MEVTYHAAPEIKSSNYPTIKGIRHKGKVLTESDIDTLVSIKESVEGGHDVEVRGIPGGGLKVLEITRKNISAR